MTVDNYCYRPPVGANTDPLTRLPRDVRRDWAALAAPTPTPRAFDPGRLDRFPAAARRWLTSAIAPGTPLATRVELTQHGRINIRSWRRFTAHQIIGGGGYIWACSTRLFGLPVRGYDRLVGDRGDMAYRLLDRIAVVDEAGPDLARSAAGRFVSELCWVPAATLDGALTWTAIDDATARVTLPIGGRDCDAQFTVAPSGALLAVATRRWASVDGEPYDWHDFGAEIHASTTFDGFTVPSRITAGYGFRGPDWPGCAFIEITVDEARYR